MTTRVVVASGSRLGPKIWLTAATVGGVSLMTATQVLASEKTFDEAQVRKDIEAVLEDLNHDDGSFGPVIVRLAWHASGTYSKATNTGGSGTGASMRFGPEKDWGANAGLHKARERLESVKAKHPNISYADLWTLAGVVAIKAMGGPDIPWKAGRVDCTEVTCPRLPDGLLPNATQGPAHLKDIFYRMGFNDREIVALSGAHTLGRCHPTASGFTNPWTNAPTTFSNLYFQDLLNTKWTRKQWHGPVQFEDPTGNLMMLATDLCLLDDPNFKKYVEMYAKDEKLFFKDFASAFGKLLELGVKFDSNKPWWKVW
jgi:cytochrome c peroxidase